MGGLIWGPSSRKQLPASRYIDMAAATCPLLVDMITLYYFHGPWLNGSAVAATRASEKGRNE